MSDRYIPPSPGEIAQVADYWDAVTNAVIRGRSVPSEDIPSQELLRKVGEFQYRQQALLCQHETIRIEPYSSFMCDICERPLRVLSDYQIEQMKDEWS